MSSTTFIDGQTIIKSSWLNDVNTEVYTNTHVNSITAGTDITVTSSIGNPVIALAGTIHSNTTGNAATASACSGNSATATTATTANQLATTLGVAGGGTGLTTLTSNGVMLGNGTAVPTFVAPSTSGYALRSTGTTWTSQKLGLGMTGEIWNFPSRALSTTYTNSNGYPIIVNVSIGSSGVVGTNKYLTAYVNGSAVSQQVIYAAGNTTCSLSVIVPTGATYYFTDAGGSSQSIAYWAELY
jgi:hypothetical protein